MIITVLLSQTAVTRSDSILLGKWTAVFFGSLGRLLTRIRLLGGVMPRLARHVGTCLSSLSGKVSTVLQDPAPGVERGVLIPAS